MNAVSKPFDSMKSIEKSLTEGISKWNRAPNFSSLLSKMNLTLSDRKKMNDLLKEGDLLKQKPFQLKFQRLEHTFRIEWNEGQESLWVLGWGPKIVLYDGEKVQQIDSKKPIESLFEFPLAPSIKKDKSPTQKGAGIHFPYDPLKISSFIGNLWQELIPSTFAQSPEWWAAYEARNLAIQKKTKQQGMQFIKLFAVGLVAFGAVGLGYHYLAPNFSSDTSSSSFVPASESVQMQGAQDHINDVKKRLLLGWDWKLQAFQCESTDKGSPVKSASFTTRKEGVKSYTFGGGGTKIEDLISGHGSEAVMLGDVDFCCKNHPCENWLSDMLAHPDALKAEQRPREYFSKEEPQPFNKNGSKSRLPMERPSKESQGKPSPKSPIKPPLEEPSLENPEAVQ